MKTNLETQILETDFKIKKTQDNIKTRQIFVKFCKVSNSEMSNRLEGVLQIKLSELNRKLNKLEKIKADLMVMHSLLMENPQKTEE